MRSMLNTSVCLVLSGLSLMLLCSSLVWPQDAKGVNPRVSELKAKRVEVLNDAWRIIMVLAQNQRWDSEGILDLRVANFAAMLEAANTQEDRIAIMDAEKEVAEWLLSRAKAMRTGAQGSKLDELMHMAYLLEIQIALENAVTNE